ncbi:hypothetical protein PWT90_06073 [Aphanocladium album]|nr:hypothetical protein PWT90_06073 [Aphanocladium album]
MMAATSTDQAFWSRLGPIFDFTLKFEEVVFGISFSSIFIILSLFTLVYFHLQPVYVRRSVLLFVKLCFTAALVGIRSALLAFAATSKDTTDTTAPAAALDLVAALFVAGWIYLEHGHSLRSSTIFTLYLFAAVLTDTAKCRSFFLRQNLAIRGGMESAAATVQLGLICLQEVSKRSDLIDANLRENLGEEATSGPISRLLFLFLGPLFRTGFREEICVDDLPQLDPGFSTVLLFEQLRTHWRPRQNIKPRATRELPFLLQQVIAMVGEDEKRPHDLGHRVGLLGATVLIFYGLPVARTASTHLLNRYVTRVRGGLVSLLFHKVHHLTQSEAKKSAAASLMTADIEGIAGGIPQCIDIPFGIIELGLGTYVLSRFIEVAALAIFAPVFVTSVATYFLGQRLGTLWAKWNKSIGERISKTTQILPQLTAIKMLGLGSTVAAYLKQLRVDEVNVSRPARRVEAVALIPALLADMMTPVVVIAAALFGGSFHGQVAAVKVFPILTVVSLIQTPLAAVLQSYPTITSMLACFTRIENFLRTGERKDPRVHLDLQPTINQQGDLIANGESRIRFHHADIAKIGMLEPLLRDVNFQLPAGSTTAVVGRTGSGKSTLIEAILGESEVLAGSVKIDTSDVSYCSQNVWLRDTTIRENIVGYEEYNEARFTRVIRACFLEEDLNWLPGGAEYVVGANGCKLSGGQRQRVAIARTAYKQSMITVLDDIFSSLDRQTAVCILYQLCGRNGILKEAGCTVVLVTYLPECLDIATNVLFLKGPGQVILSSAVMRGNPHADEIASFMSHNNINTRAATEDKEQGAIRRSLQRQAPVQRRDGDLRRKGSVEVYRPLLNLIGRLNALRALPAAIFRTIYASAYVIIQMGVILSGASFLSVILPFILVALYFIQHYYLRTSRQVRLLDLEAKTPLYTYFEETATGLSHIQAVRWQESNIRHGLYLLEKSQQPYYVMFTIQQWLTLVLGLVTGMIGIVLVALALFIREGSTGTSVGLSFIALLGLARTLEASVLAWTAMQTTSGALSRLHEFETTTPQETVTAQQELPPLWPSGGGITFTGVTARYNVEPDEQPALDQVTMNIGPGSRIGVAGRSGSGKSSLIMTLLGFLDYNGTIEIDGINLANISRDELRARVVTITQDSVQLQGTIRTNLLPLSMNSAKKQTVEEEEKAAQKDNELEQLLKNLRIWVQLPRKGGLDAKLEDVGYSKGELQLLCIARAVLKQRETRSNLVLVDEATSSVDSDTEKVVNRAMKENFVGCTILTIAHRRSSLNNVEAVIDMHRGSVIGFEQLHPDDDVSPDSDESSN